MPELPEVQTTVNGLNNKVLNLKILDIWTSYNSPYFKGSKTIKDPEFFRHFKKEVLNQQIIEAERRAKNILIHLSNNKTILIHMKMTGHLLYGKYSFNSKDKKHPWIPISPDSLRDPFNKHIRLMFSFDNGYKLALCDTRKFAKVTLLDSNNIHTSIHLKDIGPEPLHKDFDFETFKKCLYLHKNKKIKQVLLDQSVIAGIGNIYADESLWRADIIPTKNVGSINDKTLKKLFEAIKLTLSKGIEFGGDSMSDYRNIDGERGKFQEKHEAYRRTNQKCRQKSCGGIITKTVVAGRSTHFCNKHQR
jgi:formamidopyrimidine-DNA glycosylase